MKTFHSFRYIFLSLYLVYAVSPLAGNVDKAPLGGITADRSSTSLHLLLVDRFLSFVFDGDQAREEEADPADDFLVKKFRCLPAGQSLAKKLLSEGHAVVQQDVQESGCCTPKLHFTFEYSIPHDPVAAAFDGYGSHYSGLAPPVSFS